MPCYVNLMIQKNTLGFCRNLKAQVSLKCIDLCGEQLFKQVLESKNKIKKTFKVDPLK